MDYSIASRKRRIVALLIDTWVFGLLTSLIAYDVFIVLNTPFDHPWLHSPVNQAALWFSGFILFCCKDSFKGLGLGKWIMGIRVQNLNSQPAGLISSALRNLSLLVWPLETIVMIVSSNKRRMGDHLTGTQVMRDTQLSTPARAITACFVFLLYTMLPDLPKFEFTPKSFEQFAQYMVKQSDAYTVAEKAVFEHSDIEAIIGPVKSIAIGPDSQVHIENDTGNAQFILVVEGERSTIPVWITLDRQQSKWQLESLRYEQTQELPTL